LIGITFLGSSQWSIRSTAALLSYPLPGDARDAIYWIGRARDYESQTYTNIHYSGGFMSGYVKLSARKIQEVLAGRTTAQDVRAVGYLGRPFQNPFETALRQGLTS